MKIRRGAHKGNFTIVPNAIFDDVRISIEAIAVLIYLITRPPHWEIRHRHLQGILGIGRDLLKRCLIELIRAGYIVRDDEQPRDNLGNFASYDYVVSDEPNTKAAPPSDAGGPLRLNRRRRSRIGNKIKDSNTETSKTPSKPPPFEQAALPLAGDEALTGIPGDSSNGLARNSHHSSSRQRARDAIQRGLRAWIADEGLTEFGAAARAAGQTFVFENSKPWRAWIEFAGEDRLPISDIVTSSGVAKRGVWMPSLYPPRHERGVDQ